MKMELIKKTEMNILVEDYLDEKEVLEKYSEELKGI
jgi:hypothetical protein